MRANLLALALTLSMAAPLANAQSETPSQKAALKEIDVFTSQQRRTDPKYGAIEKEVVPAIDEIVLHSQPEEWLPKIKSRYFAVAERLYREERERIAAIEASAVKFVGPRQFSFDERLSQLGADLEAGRITPREQALHAFEAAKQYFPEDRDFHSYRQARVSLAAGYEMGLISRDDFEDRWRRAGQAFNAVRAADENAKALLRAKMEADLRALQVDMILRTAPVNCTSQLVFGRLQTTCR